METEFEQHHKYWRDKPDKEVQKEINRMDKRIQHLQKVGIGEMGANGHRSTRKATANFAVGNFTDQKQKLEKYLAQRRNFKGS